MSHLVTEQAKAETGAPLGLYVHVPFCASTCDFCAFYQVKPTADGVDRFLAGIAEESELVRWDRPVTTVFWGGGTPGLLSPGDLRRLGSVVHRVSGGRTPEEWTVELAPASVTAERLAALREIGVTRVSLGVQSFQPALHCRTSWPLMFVITIGSGGGYWINSSCAPLKAPGHPHMGQARRGMGTMVTFNVPSVTTTLV